MLKAKKIRLDVSEQDAATLEFNAPTMRHAIRVLNSLSAMSFMLR